MEDGQRQREHTRREWAARAGALVAGLVIAALLVGFFHSLKVDAAELALGEATTSHVVNIDGRTITAHKLPEYPNAYPERTAERPILWLGNSQMHAINQYRDGDQTAPYHATVALGRTVRCLSLPNANLQEHLVLLQWALDRNPPAAVVLALVYDDLREDGLRPEFEAVADAELMASVRALPDGDRLADQLEELHTDIGAALDAEGSLQDRTEAYLEASLSDTSVLWADRMRTLGAVTGQLYRLRNFALGIDSTSKRKMIPVRRERNMAAYRAFLDLAVERDIPLLVYVAPLRWDVEPPYHQDAYARWKEQVESMATERGVAFVDLDRLVPGRYWGTLDGTGVIDFMHFQEHGHTLLGDEIADQLRRRGLVSD